MNHGVPNNLTAGRPMVPHRTKSCAIIKYNGEFCDPVRFILGDHESA
jgi:hypothetical protein